ncbi:alpha/beta hydrolase [Qipengyuania nanhaisediminis]|uniref:alpha/beta hydrolase n=1 Tax=Qipengyuania nanhaisediminis TaxID=604088 RepID=UPI0038B2AE79
MDQELSELRFARPSLLMRAVKWLAAKRKPVFPHTADGFREHMASRRKPDDAPMPERFRDRFAVEEQRIAGHEMVTLHPRAGPGEWHMLYFHGGGFVLPMFKEHWPLAAAMVETCGISISLPLYPCVPYASHEAQEELAMAAFETLASRHDPARIALGGDSAGGHMALRLALRLSEAGGPQPGKLALFAPWLDLTMADPEMEGVEPDDIMLKIGTLRACGEMVAGASDPASHEVSPLYASSSALAGLPPTRIWTGRHDLFIVDSRSFATRLAEAGVDVRLYEYAGAPHVFMAITPTREARDTFALLKDFLSG